MQKTVADFLNSSNEAGEGSAPNAAATADVSHPVKQGLTQAALTWHIGPAGKYIIAVCILFFAFSSIIGNYYYGECNISFLFKGSRHTKAAIQVYRLVLGALVILGSPMKPSAGSRATVHRKR